MTSPSNPDRNATVELEALLRQSKPPEDWAGRTPLMALADELASLPPNDIKKQEYGWAVRQMALKFSKFTENEMQRFCFFVESAEIPASSFAEAFKAVLRCGLRSKNEVWKRAELLRLLAENGVNMNPKLLNEESQVKTKFPWYWIDAMEPLDWPTAEKTITEILSNERSVAGLLARLPYLWERHKSIKNSLGVWLRLLDGSEKEKLSEWMAHRNIHVAQSRGNSPESVEKQSVEIQPSDETFLRKAADHSYIPLSPRALS